MLGSSVLADEKDEIALVAEYTLQPMFSYMGFGHIRLQSCYFGHAWTGYEPSPFTLEEEEEEIVYITEQGTVYHRDIHCTYLNPSVKTVPAGSIGQQVNDSGGKYKRCEYCGGSAAVYIITDHGDRYHTTASCPGIKRTIHAVLLSEVGGRAPCSKCGY